LFLVFGLFFFETFQLPPPTPEFHRQRVCGKIAGVRSDIRTFEEPKGKTLGSGLTFEHLKNQMSEYQT
jgi:hypothetical protein